MEEYVMDDGTPVMIHRSWAGNPSLASVEIGGNLRRFLGLLVDGAGGLRAYPFESKWNKVTQTYKAVSCEKEAAEWLFSLLYAG